MFDPYFIIHFIIQFAHNQLNIIFLKSFSEKSSVIFLIKYREGFLGEM